MAEAANRKAGSGLPEGKPGTFSGVFTPSFLTILGIILFLRLGYVVGNAGLGRALIIIALANAISVLTTLSLSAVLFSVHQYLKRTAGPARWADSRGVRRAMGTTCGEPSGWAATSSSCPSA